MLGRRDDQPGVAAGEVGEIAGGADRRVERHPGEEDMVLVVAVDRLDDLGLARPEQGLAPAARRDLRQRGAPGAAADHPQPFELMPSPPRRAPSPPPGSSGQRARAGASSASVRPASKR